MGDGVRAPPAPASDESEAPSADAFGAGRTRACQSSATVTLYDSTFSKTIWGLYDDSKGLVVWYYHWTRACQSSALGRAVVMRSIDRRRTLAVGGGVM